MSFIQESRERMDKLAMPTDGFICPECNDCVAGYTGLDLTCTKCGKGQYITAVMYKKHIDLAFHTQELNLIVEYLESEKEKKPICCCDYADNDRLEDTINYLKG